MPDQQEELRLVVNLVDNATSLLANKKVDVVDDHAPERVRRLRKEQDDLNKSLKDMITVTSGGTQSILGMVAGFGALGAAIAVTTGVILNYSKQLAQINRQGRVMGIDPAEFKNMQEQLIKVGMSSDQASKNLIGLANAMVDLSHTGSRSWNTLITMARSHAGEMAQTIQQIELAQSATQAFNTAQQASQNVFQNRLLENQDKVKRGIISQQVAIMDAHAAANEFMDALGLDPTTRLLLTMKNQSQEQSARNQRILNEGEKVDDAVNDLILSVIDIKDQFVLAFGPGISAVITEAAGDIKAVADFLNKAGDLPDIWKKGLGDPANTPLIAPQFQHGTSMVGHEGLAYLHRDEAVIPSGSVSQDEHERKEQTDELNTNLKKLNETLYDMLNLPGDDDAANRRYKFLGGMGPGAGSEYNAPADVGGGGGDGGAAPNGSDVGPGNGAGAQEPSVLSSAPGSRGLAGLPSQGVLGDPNAGLFGTPSRGVLYPNSNSSPTAQTATNANGTPAPIAPGIDPAHTSQAGHHYYESGVVTLGGEQFHYGTGGSKAGALPFGTYPINIGKGDIGPIGQRIHSIATLGGLGGEFTGGGRHWAGVQIHTAFSNALDKLYTEGCFSIARSEWPRFKQKLLEVNAQTPGGLQLTVGPNGMASITARGQEVIPPAARDPQTAAVATTKEDATIQAGRTALDQPQKFVVNGTGKFDVKVDAPQGTSVRAQGDGILKDTQVTRTTPMPSAAANAGGQEMGF